MLSPSYTPLPAAWVAGGSPWLDSALLPFVRVPCPLPASHSWALQCRGSQQSCRRRGTWMLCVCPNPHKFTGFPWGGFPPASSPRPTGEGGHNKACTPLTSTLAAASVFTLCFAFSWVLSSAGQPPPRPPQPTVLLTSKLGFFGCCSPFFTPFLFSLTWVAWGRCPGMPWEQRVLKLWGSLGAWRCRCPFLHSSDACWDPHPSLSPSRALLRPG